MEKNNINAPTNVLSNAIGTKTICKMKIYIQENTTKIQVNIDGWCCGIPSFPPIPDDVTDGILFFCGMSRANANLVSETNTDGIFDDTRFSVPKITDNNTDGFLSISVADEFYQHISHRLLVF